MGKRKGKPAKRTKSQDKYNKIFYNQFTHEPIEEAELIKRFHNIGLNHEGIFNDSMRELSDKILRHDPLLLLSSMSFHSILEQSNNINLGNNEDSILQSEVEILHAFALKSAIDQYDKNITSPDIGYFKSLVKKLSESFSYRRMLAIKPDMSPEQRNKISVQEMIRVDTQMLRNWAYPNQALRIIQNLFDPVKLDVKNVFGIDIEHILKMFFRIAEMIRIRLDYHTKSLASILQSRNIGEMIEKYFQVFSMQDEPEDFIQYSKEQNISLNQAKQLIISHSYLALSHYFTLHFSDFIELYEAQVEPENLKHMLNTYSYYFGDLKNENEEYFFMNNPIWKKPLIKISEEEYFISIPSLLTTFSLELIEEFISTNTTIYDKYEKRRGLVLEKEIEYLFKTFWPLATVYTGSIWLDPESKKEYENDLMILIDTHLILIEAKAGKFSDVAKRGGLKSLVTDMKNLVLHPSEQSARFAKFLENNKELHHFKTKHSEINEVDTNNIKTIIQISITLSSLGMIQSQLIHLQSSEIISKDSTLSPNMTIADLETIFRVLPTYQEKIHYLIRRSQIEKNTIYLGDELDLLGWYINNGFNIGNAEFNNTAFILAGLSAPIDNYFMLPPDERKNIPLPSRKYTKLWQAFLRDLENRQPAEWLEMSYALLNTNYEKQVEFEKQIKQITKIVHRKWNVEGHINTFIMPVGPSQRENIIVGVVYKQLNLEERNQLLVNVGEIALSESTSSYALLIGFDIENNNYPRDVMAILYRSNTNI